MCIRDRCTGVVARLAEQIDADGQSQHTADDEHQRNRDHVGQRREDQHTQRHAECAPVSYTHLDVYKRQIIDGSVEIEYAHTFCFYSVIPCLRLISVSRRKRKYAVNFT